MGSAFPALGPQRKLIVERMNQARLPAIYETPETAAEGGLLAYTTAPARNSPSSGALFAIDHTPIGPGWASLDDVLWTVADPVSQ
jgi:hypothetical protein